MNPIDKVLLALDPYKVRPNGRDRWRAICPHCGGRNASTLSVGIGDQGQVLLKCFKDECEVQNITVALGLELHELFPPRQGPAGGAGPMRRRRLLPALQAIEVLEAETTLLIVYASDMAAGKPLGSADYDRLLTAAARISTIATEVRA